MQIAVMSDTHDRHEIVEEALSRLQQRNVNAVIHCGDITDSETVWLFRGFTAHFVFGNCDYERLSLQQAMHGIGATLHQPFGHLELEGVNIAFLHGHEARILHDVEHSEHFDLLFYGHTHVAKEYRTGPTRVINPGALHRANPKTLLIVDLPSMEMETVELPF